MAIIAKKSSGTYELPPQGTFQAVVFAVYDGGMQPGFNPGDTAHKIRIGIELNECYTSGQFAGQRITRYPEYTLSLSDKANLLPVVEAILNRPLTLDERENGFNLEELIGKNCQVTILHKVSQSGKDYADTKISALMKGIIEIQPVLNSDYVPEFILKWQSEGGIGTQIEPDNTVKTSIPTMTKMEMFKAIQMNILKLSPELKVEYDKDFLQYDNSFGKVPDDVMTEWYWKYGG